MAFLDNISKKFGEAAQTAAKKSEELVQVTKLNLAVDAEKDNIKRLYDELGKKTYESYCKGEILNDELKRICEQVKAHQQQIESLRQKILVIKDAKICPGCNKEIDRTASFCSICGYKQEKVEAEEAAVNTGKVCSNCNTRLDEDAIFCISCGTKVSE